MTTDSGKAWQSVGNEVAALGKHFRAYHGQLRRKAEAEDDEQAVRDGFDGFDGFAQSCKRLAASVGESLRDPAVHTEARHAAEAVFAALGKTFDELSTQRPRRSRQEQHMNEPVRGGAELVVVGVDAAHDGIEPLIFALRDAARRGAALQVVTAVPTRLGPEPS